MSTMRPRHCPGLSGDSSEDQNRFLLMAPELWPTPNFSRGPLGVHGKSGQPAQKSLMPGNPIYRSVSW
jgi:hypothetical protein